MQLLLLALLTFYLPLSKQPPSLLRCHYSQETNNPGGNEICSADGTHIACAWQEDENGNIQFYGCDRITHEEAMEPDAFHGCKEDRNHDGWSWDCRCDWTVCNKHHVPNPLGNNPRVTPIPPETTTTTTTTTNTTTTTTTTTSEKRPKTPKNQGKRTTGRRTPRGDAANRNSNGSIVFAVAAAAAVLASQIRG